MFMLLSVRFRAALDDFVGGRCAVTANDRFSGPDGAGPSTFDCGFAAPGEIRVRG
jgi:hypothetical protein